MQNLVPIQYTSVTMEEFLAEQLRAYPDVEEAIKKLTDGISAEYQAFQMHTTQRHLHALMIRQRGKYYQVRRSSSIRRTAGYERFVYHLWDVNPHEDDEANVSYRFFWEKWDDWVTLPLKN